MLKKIPISYLNVDMYIAEIVEQKGVPMPKKKKGMVRDQRIIDKFVEIGVEWVVIDTDRGLDTRPNTMNDAGEAEDESGKYRQELASNLERLMKETETQYRDIALEWGTAKEIFNTSLEIVTQSILASKAGEPIKPEYFNEAALAISRSIQRNKDALTWLGKVRDEEHYVYEHSVNCGVLMGIFARSCGFTEKQIEQCITGGLLHDLGYSHINSDLLKIKGPLSESQFAEIKSHVDVAEQAIPDNGEVGEISLKIVKEHHERIDGSGYPKGLSGDEISRYGQMFAIVDTYDAITNNRVYKESAPSSVGMKELLELSSTAFDEKLVHQFIKCMGVYPTGSLVRLNNDILGVVIAQVPGSPLKPLVRTVYNAKLKAYVDPRLTDLSRQDELKVVRYEDPRKHGINVNEFMPQDIDL